MASKKQPTRHRRADVAKPAHSIRDRSEAPEHPDDGFMTTDHGLGVTHTDNSLKAGPRGPTLLEDFHLREKITRFDHERIPERVVHARGAGAHGFFQVYDDSLAEHTHAAFLVEPGRRTPVFVRFSTVVGSRGSADTVRDVRGFAVKFYTQEGNFDLVGNNIPVFFIQDGAKFPDFVHAVKPEPDREIPQASSAHDTFWDFVSLVPETTHTVMWAMSDRGIPRSYRMMEGFGVHTFRLVNAAGVSCFVKFHWKPLLGVHSLVWDEAQKIAGKDPDFHRRDLHDAIESGHLPEWELAVQVVPEADALSFGFDLLDATKLLPEELVPLRRLGKLTLDRNPQNFFSEVEQVAFCVANIVPGIDFSNDPLMQARLFSYQDTQLTRLGGPNFAELPINRPLVPVRNHQRDGFGRHDIPSGRAHYHPNSLGGGQPPLAPATSGYVPFGERVDGTKSRERSPSFADHFSQARLFYHSLSEPERQHLIDALRFEIGKVERAEIRERVILVNLMSIDRELATLVAESVGFDLRDAASAVEHSAAKAGPRSVREPNPGTELLRVSPALSQLNSPHDSIATRKVAILIAGGFAAEEITTLADVLEAEGATVEIIAPALGTIDGLDGAVQPKQTFLTASPVLYDAVYVPGGDKSVAALLKIDAAKVFVEETFRHFKPLGATGAGIELLHGCAFGDAIPDIGDEEQAVSVTGIVLAGSNGLNEFARLFVAAMAQHRHFDREMP